MCDQQQCGKLTQDQFVMAMHLISQKVKGVELPSQVTAEMITASGHDSGFGVSGELLCSCFLNSAVTTLFRNQ